MASLGDFVDRVTTSVDPAFLLAVQQAKLEDAANSRLASLDSASSSSEEAAAAAAPLSLLQNRLEAKTRKQKKTTDGPKAHGDDSTPRKKLKPSSQGSSWHETPAPNRSWLPQAIEKTLLGMLVGDAISIPLHWYYDHAALQQHIKEHYSKIPGAVDEAGRLVAIVPIATALRSAHPSSWQYVHRSNFQNLSIACLVDRCSGKKEREKEAKTEEEIRVWLDDETDRGLSLFFFFFFFF